jgi:RNA polymerase primary sigma factor
MTRDEEIELGRRIAEDGDIEARNKLVMANMRVCEFAAKSYVGMGVDLEDLLQEGARGLMRAANKWDRTRGVRYATYANMFARDAMRSVVQKAGIIRNPPAITHRRAAIERLLDIEPGLTTGAIASQLGCTQPQVCAALSAAHVTASLDTPSADEDSDTLVELVIDPATIDPTDLADLHTALAALSPQQQRTIEARYKELPRHDLGRECGTSWADTRRAEEEALVLLEAAMR